MYDINCWKTKFKPCCYSERLLTKISLINEIAERKVDLLEIKKAIYYARKYHGIQMRQSGEPYYSHPLEVAFNVADYCFKTDILVTSVLHDTLEDTELTKDMIKYIFDANIANQAEDLTRVKFDRKISSADIIQQLYVEKKKELLIVKIFDRLHNMQTIAIKPTKRQKQIILETLQEFLPLAVYLKILIPEQKLSKLCIHANLNLEDLNLLFRHQVFSFQDNFQLLSPTFQNEIAQLYTQKLLDT